MPLSTALPAPAFAFSDAAAEQLESITSESELHALEPLVVLSVAPEAGILIPATPGPQLRQGTDDNEHIRILYFVLALRTVVVVAYIEVRRTPTRSAPGAEFSVCGALPWSLQPPPKGLGSSPLGIPRPSQLCAGRL
ncbi:hypothetical protein [Streptomyces sp. RP5T]|uniref:hypothetical protein n=1 Tax=Streptomyces sp. RP5T TaxID=2490848 RepID=UPI0026D54162|nr:hypothetical protein [Streptomyces sp. RP5T]